MHLRVFTTLTWISASLIGSLTILAAETRNPYVGETIAHYLGRLDIVNITENAQFSTDEPPAEADINTSNSQSGKNDTGRINDRDISSVTEIQSIPWRPSPVTGRPMLYKSTPVALTAASNDTEDRGYNITIPGCSPADTIVGDWTSPSGILIENCTLAQMAQKLTLPSATLTDFTAKRAAALLAKINSTMQGAVCEPPLTPPDRELKAVARPGFRFDPEKQSGYFSSLFIVIGGAYGISFAGLHLGIIHEGITANISIQTEVVILAAFAALGTTCVVIFERERRHMARVEALVLNAFLSLGEKIYDKLASGVHCIQEMPLKNQLQTVAGKLSQGARVLVTEDVQAAAMRDAGSSSVNLVAQGGDIENQLTCGH